MEEKNIIIKSGSFVKNSATVKIVVIVIISLLLFMPLSMVKALISERSIRQNQVINEISRKWGASQTVAGPVLTVPYKAFRQNNNDSTNPPAVTRYVHFLPETLSIKGTIEPELRYRGIYEALLYRSDLEISGEFAHPDLHKFSIEPDAVMWDKVFLSMGISDMSGIQEQVSGKVANKDIVLEPGIETADVFQSGVSARFSLEGEAAPLPFTFKIRINGNRNLSFLPLGKETGALLSSTWPDPSFSGQFLPNTREMSDSGFSAGWKVLHLNRNYPQSWKGKGSDLSASLFGVSLHPGTEIYQKSMRTAKYGGMFVLFAFTAFFLAEVINKTKIHPIQYLLVGCSIVTFYVFLLALSEHLGFNISFLISAFSVILLISGYTRSILSRKMAAVLCAILTTLYGYLFITLQLEDYALLVGSFGLFTTLTVVRYLTRKVDWYGIQPSSVSNGLGVE